MLMTPSRALLPRQGAPAACALCPLNVKTAEMRASAGSSPQEMPYSSLTCANRFASTSRNTPARTRNALLASCSSATPGHSRMVPGMCSRAMTSFTARAARMVRGTPLLCPSPWPGAPATIGSCAATPGFWLACGMQSMSEPRAITGLPLPQRATHAAVVSFAVAGRVGDDRVVRRHPRLLAGLRDAVDVGAEGDHGLAAPPARHPRGGEPGHAALEREAVALEHPGQVPRGLDLLHAELAEGVDLVDHLLRERRLRIDGAGEFRLEAVEPPIRGRLCGDARAQQQQRDEQADGAHGNAAPRNDALRRDPAPGRACHGLDTRRSGGQVSTPSIRFSRSYPQTRDGVALHTL